MTIPIMSSMLLIGLMLTGATVIAILMDQRDNVNRDFAVLGLFCSALLLLSYYMELNEPGLASKIAAVKFGYIGRAFVNPMLLMLVVRYYDLHMRKIWQCLLYLIPLITVYLVFQCEHNKLYYSDLDLGPDGLLHVEAGPFYYIYMGYNVLLVMMYLSCCLYQRPNLRGRDKHANTLLILANLIPFFFLMIYLAGWTRGFDTSALGVMAGALLVALAIFRYGLLDKTAMLQSMATGLVFLDHENRMVYANRAAIKILPILAEQTRAQKDDLSQLCSDKFAAFQVGSATYQRRMDDWSTGDGQHGKILTFDDITEIRSRLNRDAMTGLLNHATFYPMLDEAMAECKNSNGTVSVAIADIDFFKRINDTYGHANGDIVLIALADTLTDFCEDFGSIFRYGGEEFAIIFDCDLDYAENIMQKALDYFSQVEFDFMDENVTFSFGTAEYSKAETSVALFDRADQIMYARKRMLHEKEREEAAAKGIALPVDSRL